MQYIQFLYLNVAAKFRKTTLQYIILYNIYINNNVLSLSYSLYYSTVYHVSQAAEDSLHYIP